MIININDSCNDNDKGYNANGYMMKIIVMIILQNPKDVSP